MIQDTSVRDFSGVLTEILLAAKHRPSASLDFSASYLFVDGKFIENGRGGPSESQACRRRCRHSRMASLRAWSSGCYALARDGSGFRVRHTESRLGRALAAASYLFWPSWDKPITGPRLGTPWIRSTLLRAGTRIAGTVGQQNNGIPRNRTSHKKDLPNMYNFRCGLSMGT